MHLALQTLRDRSEDVPWIWHSNLTRNELDRLVGKYGAVDEQIAETIRETVTKQDPVKTALLALTQDKTLFDTLFPNGEMTFATIEAVRRGLGPDTADSPDAPKHSILRQLENLLRDGKLSIRQLTEIEKQYAVISPENLPQWWKDALTSYEKATQPKEDALRVLTSDQLFTQALLPGGVADAESLARVKPTINQNPDPSDQAAQAKLNAFNYLSELVKHGPVTYDDLTRLAMAAGIRDNRKQFPIWWQNHLTVEQKKALKDVLGEYFSKPGSSMSLSALTKLERQHRILSYAYDQMQPGGSLERLKNKEGGIDKGTVDRELALVREALLKESNKDNRTALEQTKAVLELLYANRSGSYFRSSDFTPDKLNNLFKINGVITDQDISNRKADQTKEQWTTFIRDFKADDVFNAVTHQGTIKEITAAVLNQLIQDNNFKTNHAALLQFLSQQLNTAKDRKLSLGEIGLRALEAGIEEKELPIWYQQHPNWKKEAQDARQPQAHTEEPKIIDSDKTSLSVILSDPLFAQFFPLLTKGHPGLIQLAEVNAAIDTIRERNKTKHENRLTASLEALADIIKKFGTGENDAKTLTVARLSELSHTEQN